MSLSRDEVLFAYSEGAISPEEAGQLLDKLANKPVDWQAGVEKLAKPVAAAGTGTLWGLAGLAGMPGWAVNTIKSTGLDKYAIPPYGIEKNLPRLPEAQDIRRFAEKTTGITPYQPQGAVENYIARGAEGMVGMTPTSKLQAAAGLATGVAGEAGANLMAEKGEDRETGRALGSTLALLASLYTAMKMPRKEALLREPLKELGPGGIQRAAETAKGAEKAMQVETGFWQGTPTDTSLDAVVESVIRSPYGQKMRETLSKQIPVGRDVVERHLTEISPRELTQEGANEVLRSGKQVLRGAQELRKEVTQPLYKEAKEVIPTDHVMITAEMKQGLSDMLPEAFSGKASRALRNLLGRHEGGAVPVTQLQAVARLFRGEGQSAMQAGKNEIYKAKQMMAEELDNLALSASKPLRDATEEFRRLSETLVTPIQESIWGKMFTKEMRKSGAGNWAGYRGVLDQAQPEDVARLGGYLRLADKEAFPAVVKDNWTSKFESVLKGKEGQLSGSILEDIPNTIAGLRGTKTRAKFDAIQRELALSAGQDPAARVAAANKLMDGMYVMSRGQRFVGPVAGVKEVAKETGVSKALESFGYFYVVRKWGRHLGDLSYRKTYTDVADLLTNPSRWGELEKIASFDLGSYRMQKALRGLIAAGVVNTGEEEE